MTIRARCSRCATGLWSLGLLLLAVAPARAEMIEEIVAWVNGEIITKSDLEFEEEALTSEAYRRFTGEDLDKQVERLRQGLLLEMIDRKILLSHAKLVYDISKLSDAFYEEFRRQQGYEDEEEFERLLTQDGMTVAALKERLVEMFAPDEVKRMEVGSRISVAEAEVRSYYDEHPDEFVVAGEIVLREIVLLADNPTRRDERRDEAEGIRQRVIGGEDFEEVARELSEAGTKTQGGLLGPLKRGDLAPRLEQVAFGMAEGQVSELIETDYGFHLLTVESKVDDELMPYEEIQDRLRAALEDRKYRRELQQFLKTAREEAEWCVKSAFRERLSIESPPCTSL